MAKKNKEITVEEKLRALYDLQIIDSRLDEIRNTRGELPIEVEDLENDIEGLKTRAQKIENEIKEQNDSIKEKKELIASANSLTEKYKSQQEDIRNNKEYEIFEKEIEYQDLEIQLAEKRIKEYKAIIAQKNEKLEEINSKIEQYQSDLKFKNEELDGLLSETQKEEEYLLSKSEEFAEKVQGRLLKSYKRIRENCKNGLAVVGLERGAPKGSFFTLPPQKQMEVAQRKKIVIDEHSGKILVDDELVNEETEKMKSVIKFS